MHDAPQVVAAHKLCFEDEVLKRKFTQVARCCPRSPHLLSVNLEC